MIIKVNKIKDFGVFKNFNGNALSDFKTFNLIYGWNYSGKTTLSRIFRCLEKGKLHDDYKVASFELSHTSGKFDNTFVTSANIRVFNSDFIRENLKWDADKIEPILLLGAENIELQKKLEEAEKELKESEVKLTELRKEKEDKLKKQNKALTDKAKSIATLLGLTVFDRDHLRKLVESTLPEHLLNSSDFEKYKTLALSTEQKPTVSLLNIEFSNLDASKNEVSEILGKLVASAKRIQKLLDDKTLSNWVEQGKNLHLDKDNCEFCGNKLPANLLASLNEHFSKEYETLKNEITDKITALENSKIDLSTSLPAVTAFYTDIQLEYQLTRPVLEKEVQTFNKAIESLITDLKSKQLKPFDVLKLKPIKNNSVEATQSLDNFNSAIKKNNKRTADFDIEKKAAIDKIKNHLAADFEATESYSATKAQLMLDQTAIDEQAQGIEKKKGDILDIKSQLSETVKGASKINNHLRLFFGKDDVKIEATSDNKFKLIRGNEVAKNLSEGEKTAISFVYFTTKLEEQNNKLGETIVYIDDPVSSLDSTHLFNIYSFIRNTFYEATKDANGGKLHISKAKQLFISTHNFEFYNLIYDWFDDIRKAQISKAYFIVERIKNAHKDESAIIESNNSIQKYKSEYAYLFSLIYRFHKTPSDTAENIYYLPNILRKFLETYLNFKFLSSVNIEESITKVIKNPIECERARKFMHYYSHSLTTDSFMRFPDLAECSEAVRIVLEAIEKDDPTHFNSLTERAII